MHVGYKLILFWQVSLCVPVSSLLVTQVSVFQSPCIVTGIMTAQKTVMKEIAVCAFSFFQSFKILNYTSIKKFINSGEKKPPIDKKTNCSKGYHTKIWYSQWKCKENNWYAVWVKYKKNFTLWWICLSNPFSLQWYTLQWSGLLPVWQWQMCQHPQGMWREGRLWGRVRRDRLWSVNTLNFIYQRGKGGGGT